MKVAATVIDLRAHSPRAEERFLVDTNIWLDLSYPPLARTASANLLTRIDAHTQFVKRAREVGAQLMWCALTFFEISHVIEKTERELYIELTGDEISLKQFRQHKNRRVKTIEQVNLAWDTINSLATIGIPVAGVQPAHMDDLRADFANCHLDGHDLLLLRSMRDAGVSSVVTDDADYLSFPRISVLTANEFALRQAAQAIRHANRG